jgi:hypothetical protein
MESVTDVSRAVFSQVTQGKRTLKTEATGSSGTVVNTYVSTRCQSSEVQMKIFPLSISEEMQTSEDWDTNLIIFARGDHGSQEPINNPFILR